MRYLIAGGGTGGHIIPGINIARSLLKVDAEANFLFLGTERGLEGEIVPKAGFQIEMIEAKPWRGIRSLKNIMRSTIQVKKIIRSFGADAVIGTGGYVSAPAVLASRMTAKPLFIQEQNAYPGLATKLGSLFARCVFLGFPQAEKFLWRRKCCEHSGNPVMMKLPALSAEQARREFGLLPNRSTILVTGGSQGAAAINEAVKNMLQKKGIPRSAQMIWQCGKREFESLKRATEGIQLPFALVDFIDDMGKAYRAADIVVCRSGALTLAEIAIAGLPAILIPYPHAAGGHQVENGKVFVKAGAAVMLYQSELTHTLLYATLSDLLSDHRRMINMSKSAQELAKPNAADEIAKKIKRLMKNK